MAREEERRRKEAEAAKARLESEQKKQGNEITQMFDRLKSENEQASQCETCLCFNPILKHTGPTREPSLLFDYH